MALQLTTTTTTTISTTTATTELTIKPKELFEVLGITKQCEQQKFQQQQHKPIELSQIELIYRAEGNANLVLALPQYGKVLRLPKIQKQQQQQHQQLPELALNTGHQQNQKDAENLTMEHFAAYISIVRCLLGNEFIFDADIVDFLNPNDRHWINNHIRPHRPVNRLDKVFSGRAGLLLPDAAQLPAEFGLLFPNLQPTGDTYAIEIKPKQGWLLNEEFDTLFNKKRPKPSTVTESKDGHCQMQKTREMKYETKTTITAATTQKTPPSPAMNTRVDIRCRYCSMQFLKLKQQKIHQPSGYCPLKLFSGVPHTMSDALQALFQCPQNNLRVYRNGLLIYDDQLSKLNNIETIFPSDKLQLIKHLLVTCLLKDYSQNMSDASKDDNISAASVSCVAGIEATSSSSDTTTTGQQPYSKVISRERSEKTGEPHLKQQQQQQQHQHQPHLHCVPAIVETEMTSYTLLLPTNVQESLHSVMITTELASTTTTPITTTTTNRISSCVRSVQNEEQEMLCLPKNCVLQKILQLQLLAKKNFLYMLEQQYHEKTLKSYNHLMKLLKKYKLYEKQLNFSHLDNEEEYILAATALDCSIMIAFREVTSSECLSTSPSPYMIEFPELNRRFITKVTLLDLDPKPDNHFAKYCQQTEDILNLFQ